MDNPMPADGALVDVDAMDDADTIDDADAGALDAIVLAGGSARRLAGIDKPGVLIGDRTLLEISVAAAGAAAARRVVVVGPRRPVPGVDAWRREDPVGAGPVAALAAGLPATRAACVLVLGADLPFVRPAVPALLSAVRHDEAVGAAVLVDGTGRANYLAAVWRRSALVAALSRLGDTAGASMRALVRDVTLGEVADVDGWGRDCDTWEDVARARSRWSEGAWAR